MSDKFNKMTMSDIILHHGTMVDANMDMREATAFSTQLVNKLKRFHTIVVEMEKADAQWAKGLTKILRETLES